MPANPSPPAPHHSHDSRRSRDAQREIRQGIEAVPAAGVGHAPAMRAGTAAGQGEIGY